MNNSTPLLQNISDNISKVILGKDEVIKKVLIAFICEGNVLIDDIPGVGKTALVSALSKSINAIFRRIQFTPDVLPSDVTGFSILNKETNKFEFSKGAIFTNILLVDEINRASPKTQSSLLEAMEESQVTVDGKTYELPKPFMVLATQNPVECSGTYSLPEAQMDRFLMKISIGYPSYNDEINILGTYKTTNPLASLTHVATTDDILTLQSKVKNVFVHSAIKKYILDLITNSRNHKYLSLGVSPRGSLALLRAGQGVATLNGRDYVIPDDIKEIASCVLAHRFMLSPEAKIKKITSETVMNDLIANTTIMVTGYDKE